MIAFAFYCVMVLLVSYCFIVVFDCIAFGLCVVWLLVWSGGFY